jgi:Asp-tRNA(Asn)/Glu-tRNA(Gln) amidotransferase A subunit family amidase
MRPVRRSWSGQVTALELLEAAIERIEAADPGINAVVMRGLTRTP